MSTDESGAGRVPIEPQRVDAPLTSSAVLLTLTLTQAVGAVDTVRGVLGDLDDIVKNVSFRDLSAALACTVGIGSDVWDAVTRAPRPRELHPFRDVRGAVRCYRGPVLPRSTAPGVERIRGDLAAGLRQALVHSGQPDLMAAWTRSRVSGLTG